MQQKKIFILKDKTNLDLISSKLIVSKLTQSLDGKNPEIKVNYLKLPLNSFDLSENKVFIKKSVVKDEKILNSFFENFRLILKGYEVFFFVHLTITGLGFRIRRYLKKNVCFLRIELGYSHYIYYPLPKNVFFSKGRKKCLLYSDNFNLLKRITNQITTLRKINPYKEKGLLITGKKFYKKSGKQEQK